MKKIAKILSIVLCLAMVLSFASMAFAAESTATISFADEANRVSVSADQQVWQQNGITVTNDKADSTNDVKDYANPVRFYKGSSVTIAYPGMTTIVVTCNSEKYATALVDSVTGASATAAGKIVTITLEAAADSFVIAMGAQVRVDEIAVYTGEAAAPIIVTEYNVDDHMDASKWTFNGEKAAIENGQLNLPAVGDTAAAMLNESAQNASFKFTLTINEVPADCYDKWWDTELLIIARSSLAEKSWSDEFAQTGYTLTSWGDMTEWFIGRAGNDDLSGKIVLNIADGQPHDIELKVVNNADSTAVTVTLIVDGEQKAEIVDDGTKIKNDRPALYPEAGNFTVRAKNVDVSVGVAAPSEPAADSTLTIAEAIALGASKEHNTYTAGKYYVTGEITEVYNETYGNMKIKDADGNILTVYGTYSADGAIRYDAMEVKPVAGDIVTVYGIIGQYKDTPQIKNGWITAHTPAVVEPVAESKTITIGERTFTAEGGKWLYNTYVNEQVASDPSNAYMYSMIIFDKGYTGEAFNTNSYGCAIVLDKYGTLIKIYDGANGGFWTVEGKAASAHFTTATFATVAWSELQEGETLIIFPNDGASNTARKWALDLRNAGTENPSECGKTATLEGFTFEPAPVEPEPSVPETSVPETSAPDVTPDDGDVPTGGDAFGIVVALMAASGIALVALKKKEN